MNFNNGLRYTQCLILKCKLTNGIVYDTILETQNMLIWTKLMLHASPITDMKISYPIYNFTVSVAGENGACQNMNQLSRSMITKFLFV